LRDEEKEKKMVPFSGDERGERKGPSLPYHLKGGKRKHEFQT